MSLDHTDTGAASALPGSHPQRPGRFYQAFRRMLRSDRCIIGVPAALLGFVPLVFWTGAFSSRMALGGDDSLLYYSNPSAWLHHSPMSVLGAGFFGFNPSTWWWPFLAILRVLDLLPLNTQGTALGLALLATFVGYAKLVLLLLGDFPRPARLAAALAAGTVATCSPIVLVSQAHYLVGTYWQPLLPWVVVAYAAHQRAGGPLRLLGMSAVVVVGSAPLLQYPWTLAAAPLFIALVVAVHFVGRIRFSFRRLAIAVVAVTATNLFWILPLAGIFRYSSYQVADATSASGVSTAVGIVRALASTQSFWSAIGLRFSQSFLTSIQSPDVGPNAWPTKLAVVGMLPAALIVIAVAVSFRRRSRGRRHLATVVLAGTVAYLYLFAVSLRGVPNGAALFERLVASVPGMTAVRRFLDKFPIPFAGAVAVATAAATAILAERAGKRIIAATTAVGCLAFAIYAMPMLSGSQFRRPYQGPTGRDRVLTGLPQSYRELLSHITSLPPGPVLTLPLGVTDWSVVPGPSGQGTYLGLSPIFYLTGRSDYDGLDSFISPAFPHLRDKVERAFERGDVATIGEVVQLLGVRYVLTNDDHSGLSNPSTYEVGFQGAAAEDAVSAAVAGAIAPHVLFTTGRWQLREVASGFVAPLAEGGSPGCQSPLMSISTASTKIIVRVPANASSCLVVIRQPFVQGWVTSGAGLAVGPPANDGGLLSFSLGPHEQATVVTVDYAPQRLLVVGAALSLLAGVLLLASSAAATLTRRRPYRAAVRRRPSGILS